ncbi:MAG: 23S rRNA (pseudouridine(1915)-N(3))-methyltransferase RlmH [Candidatus Thalassarchaeaceae archaeon]|nr:23S rRNA (pseudouridine(1915)-N(3))-methyltransferase RlmH [Candidatus Thalassarchaeaceae archaeon]
MARIVVHTHGKAREKGYSHLIDKYSERLKNRGVTLIVHSGRLDHDDYVSKVETAATNGALILLDENGQSGTTEWMFLNWKRWRLSPTAIHLAIGPVDGFESDVVDKHETISLGLLTLTYEMAAVVLLEQLYRASEMDRGSPYHRD